jgi:hypothetical protein
VDEDDDELLEEEDGAELEGAEDAGAEEPDDGLEAGVDEGAVFTDATTGVDEDGAAAWWTAGFFAAPWWVATCRFAAL